MKPWVPAGLLLALAACNPPAWPETSPPPTTSGSLPACSAIAFNAAGTGLNSNTFTQALNQIRAAPCRCAKEDFPSPSPPVTWNPLLEGAAQAHSQDMQQHNFFSHTGSDGSNPGQRIARTGYSAASWGENIAAGYPDMNTVLRGWLESKSGHCEAIKNPSFSEIGAALVEGSSSNTYRTYWTLVLARPR
ncbi:uncharacterized protein, YkwD family [Meiothermus luteus]|jgi:uncharacterized protein YkwD|uniref:Uncharacterized protein, YkwD family n=1 Tax=Meiothermus luteus TaxID=2026184 RepID=A0A399EX90_9DEIN|nr:CAP domain-containing protein [Meiothermus luteus]RIH86911.1 uncharacterized protein, YkwD family [Meiothermus luteus]RMH55386.1 MAG: CAP domain-containing protein [Deinococcota bacterium]